MNVTFNTNSLNNKRYNLNNQIKVQSFTANPSIAAAEEVLAKASNTESGFFKPFTDAYNNMTDTIADKFTSKLVDLKGLNWLADKLKNSSNLYQHCMTIGSVITSGLYMQRTLANKEFDKDRKNPLAVNQGLTFGVSTIGAYTLDKYAKGWWDNVTARFAGHLLGDNKFYNEYLKQKEEIIKENKKIKAEARINNTKPELKSLPKATKLVEKHPYYQSLLKNSEKDAKVLMTKVKGMSPLRAMIVFGFVYRYFVPVVVTKPANMLCEKYLAHKKNKQTSNN